MRHNSPHLTTVTTMTTFLLSRRHSCDRGGSGAKRLQKPSYEAVYRKHRDTLRLAANASNIERLR